MSSEYLVLNCKWFLSLFNLSCMVFITYIIVSFPWRWWRRGVWQYCKWWSKISTLSVHRSHLYNETGKKVIKYYTIPLLTCFVSYLKKINCFYEEQSTLKNLYATIFATIKFQTSFIYAVPCCLSPFFFFALNVISVPFHLIIQEQVFLFEMWNTKINFLPELSFNVISN